MNSYFDPIVNFVGGKMWAPTQLKRIDSFINTGDKVIDIGSGGGWTGELIKEHKQADVTLLDVQDLNYSKLPITVYDGKEIPFKDNSFDVGLLLFVLHHCQNPEQVLQEAARVSKKLIILEDTFQSWFGRLFVCANDIVTNLPSALITKQSIKGHLPLSFKKISEWTALFKQMNMSLTYVAQQEKLVISPRKTLFILDKN